MLPDRYGLSLSTLSSAARDAYVEGCGLKLTMYPGAIEAFDRAIAADPGFALAHAAKAHALLERGDAGGVQLDHHVGEPGAKSARSGPGRQAPTGHRCERRPTSHHRYRRERELRPPSRPST